MLSSAKDNSHSHSTHNHHSLHRKMNKYLNREIEIIKNRVIMVVISWILCVVLDASQGIILGFQIYLLATLSTAISYKFAPRPSELRKFIGLCSDFGAGIYFSYIAGENVAVFYPIYLWVILGYGFRFGLKWLFTAAVMGTLSFGWTVYHVEYWHHNWSLTIGLLVGLIAIPAYCSTLITKISVARVEAEEANKAKSLFLASISHELRTPLNAIIGYGTHMLDMKLPDTQRQMTATSVSAGKHLLHLINQLLSFAHSDSREELPTPKEFSITEVLSEVRDIMQIAADEKGLKIHLQAEAMSDRLILGQLDHIRNILINLTSNAVKFTSTGSVMLRCGIDEQSNLWCSVTDTGPGIAVEAQQKIFQVFQQADDSVGEKFGGTGLGLAICRKLVTQMEGDIILKSILGSGSTFTMACPIVFAAKEEVISADETFRILSLGTNKRCPSIEGNDSNIVKIYHIQYSQNDDLLAILKRQLLQTYDLAIIDSTIAGQYDQESPIWALFREAKLPPVLLSDGETKNLDEIQLRAAFASVIPASPDFDTVRSVVQIGCSFNGHTAQIDEPAVAPQQTASRSLRILVADDNRTNQMVLETILSNSGHIVTVVPNGEEALNELENITFDIVFLDVNMPIMGGIECAKTWRQIEGSRQHIPIIGLTADATDETEKRCLDAGMDLRLTKPIETKILLDTIAQQSVASTPQPENISASDPFEVVIPMKVQSTPDSSDSIDQSQMEYLLSIGDEAFVQSIIDTYLEDASDILSAFETSVEEENVVDFRFHAHAFKSGANNVGAVKLSEMCAKLEVITEPEFNAQRFKYLTLISDEIDNIGRCLREETMDSDAPTEDRSNIG